VTTEDSTLREVDQELAEERQFAIIKRLGPALISFAVLSVIGVAGWQFYTHQKTSKADQGAREYQEALFTLTEDPVAGQDQLIDLSENSHAGYATLARFRSAALLASQGDTPRAHNAYKAIFEGELVSPHLKDLARLRAAYLSLDFGGKDAVITDLGDLPAKKSPLGAYAREVLALAYLSAKDYDKAIAEFDNLVSGSQTPVQLRARAEEFAVVARAGRSGANITGEARVEDLLKQVGDIPADSAIENGNSNPETVADEVEGIINEAIAETGITGDASAIEVPAASDLSSEIGSKIKNTIDSSVDQAKQDVEALIEKEADEVADSIDDAAQP